MEWIHSVHLPVLDIDIPWWTAIALGLIVASFNCVLVTAAIRLSTFPLVRLGRRNAALTIEHKDELKAYEERGKIARAEGNNLLSELYLNWVNFPFSTANRARTTRFHEAERNKGV